MMELIDELLLLKYSHYWKDRISDSPIFKQLVSPKFNPDMIQMPAMGPGSSTPEASGSDEGTGNTPSSGSDGGKPGQGPVSMPANFVEPVKELIQLPGLQKLTNGDPEMAEDITREILGFMQKAEDEIADKEKNPLKDEWEMLENFKKVTPGEFNENWKETEPFLKKTYKKKQIDTTFYSGQFQKSLESGAKPKGKKAAKKILFDSVKKNLVDKWEKLLNKKQEDYEKAIIEKYKEQLRIDLEERLQKMKILMKMLAPFELKPSQVFGFAKGEWKRRNLDILKDFADLLARDNSIKELADLLGRVSQAEKEQERETYMKSVIVPEFKPVHAGKSEIMGVRQSDDIANMLSSEMLLLCDEDLELIFYKNFIEKKLQTYEYQGKYLTAREEDTPDVRIKETEGIRGPYILCVDTSGSMEGNPEVVCKVLAFALTKRALSEKRKCFLITFSSGIKTFELTDMSNSIQALLDFLGFSFHGGTDAGPALEAAVNKIMNDDGFKKADVMMLSDFQMGSLEPDLVLKMKAAKENKTKFNSLVITSGSYGLSSGIDSGANQSVLEIFDNNWSFNPDNQHEVVALSQKLNPPVTKSWARPVFFRYP